MATRSLQDLDPVSPAGLRARALVAGLSIRELSRLTHIPYDRLGRLLRGDMPPRQGELDQIARAIETREAC